MSTNLPNGSQTVTDEPATKKPTAAELMTALAVALYAAFGDRTTCDAHRGQAIPKWEDVGDVVRRFWSKVAMDIGGVVQGGTSLNDIVSLCVHMGPAFAHPSGWRDGWPSLEQILEHAGDGEMRMWLARRPTGELVLGHFDEERVFAFGRASGYAFPFHADAGAWEFCPIDEWGRPVQLRSSEPATSAKASAA